MSDDYWHVSILEAIGYLVRNEGFGYVVEVYTVDDERVLLGSTKDCSVDFDILQRVDTDSLEVRVLAGNNPIGILFNTQEGVHSVVHDDKADELFDDMQKFYLPF